MKMRDEEWYWENCELKTANGNKIDADNPKAVEIDCGGGGAWVQCWVFVPDPEEEKGES
jgi:hypothetical protein